MFDYDEKDDRHGFMQQPQPHSNFHCNCLVSSYYGDGFMQQVPQLTRIFVNVHELLSISATYWLNNKENLYISISLPQNDLSGHRLTLCVCTLYTFKLQRWNIMMKMILEPKIRNLINPVLNNNNMSRY